MAIRWEDSRFTAVYGYVGQLHLFTVVMSSTRGGGWEVGTRLPIALTEDEAKGHRSKGAAQVKAEAVLDKFIRHILKHRKYGDA